MQEDVLAQRFTAVALGTAIDLYDIGVLALANTVYYLKNRRLVKRYRQYHHRWPHLTVPRTYPERMLWRKVVDHNPLFIVFTDKLACKEYLGRVCPELALPRTLWVGKNADEIPDHLLESNNVFVKATHGMAYNYPIKRGQLDRVHLKETTDGWLNKVFGRAGGQWAYSQVEPRLFVEEWIGGGDRALFEVKIRACNGETVGGYMIGEYRTANEWRAYLDNEGKPAPNPWVEDGTPIAQLPSADLLRPYLQALKFARHLSSGIDFARFDFIWDGVRLYGGEITIYPAAGISDIRSSSIRKAMLEAWDLRASYFLRSRQTGLNRLYAHSLQRQLQHYKRHGVRRRKQPTRSLGNQRG